jgi:ribosomal protein S12 methylthiotransferase accessory factor
VSTSKFPHQLLANRGDACSLRSDSRVPEEPDALNQFFSKVWPVARRAGVTRLGDISGLDRLGLPVVQAVRPGALSEATSLGRGFRPVEAAVGALMESLERFYAEQHFTDRIFLATADDLGVKDGLFNSHVRTPKKDSSWRRLSIPWIMGVDAQSGEPHPVPLELVHTRYTVLPEPPGDGVFVRSTTGLACHSHWREALTHSLFECIERDAISRAFETHGFFDRMRLDPQRQLGSRTAQLLARLHGTSISVAFWLAPSPTRVPVVWCQTIEIGPREPILALPTEGFAAAESIDAAAQSALLEALATRPSAISGTRDDLTLDHYRPSNDMIVLDARELITQEPLRGEAFDVTPVTDYDDLVKRATTGGLGPVLVVSVGADEEGGVSCVRTVLPRAHAYSVLR